MSRTIGPNFKRLMAYKVAREAVPPGGGMASAIQSIVTPGRLSELSRDALVWCDAAIDAIRSAPDNPYGNDEETIAGAILNELDKK